jgi:hypothetical protein
MRRILITPPFPLPLYILAFGLWYLGWKILFDLYIEARMHVYNQPEHDGEPFAIALVHFTTHIFFTPFFVPFICFILSKYPGSVPLLAWNHQKHWLSVLWTVLFLFMVFLTLLETQEMIFFSFAF